MDGNTRHWVEEATALAKKAAGDGVLVLFKKTDDDGCDVVITHATSAGTVKELGRALSSGYSDDSEE